MNELYEDIDEDLDELDDEALGSESFAEKRRRRRGGPQPKGGGYNQPRLDKSPVTQTQLQAALARVGEDVKKLALSVKSLEGRADTTITRLRKDNEKFAQMSMLMPLMTKKSVTVNAATNGIPANTRVLIDDNDMMSMMLPMMMMGSMGSSSNGSGQNDMMMLMVMVMAMDKGRTP